MPSRLPASEPGRKFLRSETTIPSLGRAIMRRVEDPDISAAYPNARAQRIWTIERAKHSAG